MTDDIVTRLRIEADKIRADAFDISTAFENCADEIERLRKQIREQKCCQQAADEIMRMRAKLVEFEQELQIQPVSSAPMPNGFKLMPKWYQRLSNWLDERGCND